MAFDWAYPTTERWKDKVDGELVQIKQNINILALRIKDIQGGKGGKAAAEGGSGSSGRRSVPVIPLKDFAIKAGSGQMAFGEDGNLEDLVPAQTTDEDDSEEGGGMSSAKIQQGTYAIQQATISMRGYLMLLGEAGLSKDQKKMVAQLETSMMMVMKIAATINVAMGLMKLAASGGLDPTAYMQVIMGGGYAASAIAYGMKTTGSGV